MTQSELAKINDKVESAIRKLYQRDLYLFEIGVHERTVACKFAECLQHEFRGDWNVDCEYNRDGHETKSLEMIVENDDEKREHNIFPDIIIHTRGKSGKAFNKLVIEIKTSNKDNVGDVQKLCGLTSLEYNFKYQYGLFLRFNHIFQGTIPFEEFVMEKRWFHKGQEINYENQ